MIAAHDEYCHGPVKIRFLIPMAFRRAKVVMRVFRGQGYRLHPMWILTLFYLVILSVAMEL